MQPDQLLQIGLTVAPLVLGGLIGFFRLQKETGKDIDEVKGIVMNNRVMIEHRFTKLEEAVQQNSDKIYALADKRRGLRFWSL